MTRGSAQIHLGPYDDFLQIDAAINLGNSGGPTFDLNGRVIGINTAIYSPNTGSVGIGFAVPANLAQPVIAQLKARGKVERGWLGVRIQDLTPELAQSFGLPKAEGGLVADVTADGPAARAGFAQGDVILSVNGQVIGKKRDVLLALAAMPIGQKAEMRVWRQNAEIVLRPIIGEMPGSPQIVAIAPKVTQSKDFTIGLNLAPLTEARRQLLGISAQHQGRDRSVDRRRQRLSAFWHPAGGRDREHQPTARQLARGGYLPPQASSGERAEECTDADQSPRHQPLPRNVAGEQTEWARRWLTANAIGCHGTRRM